MSDRVSAGELRAMGIPVPPRVPDCATVPRDSWQLVPGTMSIDGSMYHMQMDVLFLAPFEWVTVKVEVKE